MKETIYTPGPWGVYEDPDTDEIEIRQLRDCRKGVWSWEKIASDVSENNAHLLAAAPTLLKALKRLYELTVANVLSPYPNAWGPETNDAVIEAKVAIDVAEYSGE